MKKICIICFFDDYRHKRIRSILYRNQKHINLLKRYRDSIDKMLSLKSEFCKRHTLYKNKPYINQVEYTLKNNKIKINEFMDELISSYQTFIHGKHILAYQNLKLAFDKIDLLNQAYDHNNSNNCIFFRARKKKKGKFYFKEDLFHIKFSKIELVGNQRYSSTGQPFLYLGRSLLNIKEELEIEKKYAQFVYTCYIIKDWKNFKYFRLYNTFEHRFYSYRMNKFEEDIQRNEKDSDTLKAIFKFLLSQFCSFKKRKKGTFIEEYVLPQLIVEYVKENNFKGIMYKSTKLFRDIEASDHMYNLVLFTNYSSDENIDFDDFLEKNFVFSDPQNYNKSNQIKLSNLNSNIKQKKPDFNKYIDIIAYHDSQYLNLKINSRINFGNTPFGKFQHHLINETLKIL